MPLWLLVPLTGVAVLLLALLAVGKVPLGYNVRNLMVRWWITSLTALAFTLVVGLLTVLLAFVNGMYQLTEGSGHPGNVMVLSDGATDELFSNLAYGDYSDIASKVHPDLRPLLEYDERGRPLASQELYLVANQPVPGTPADRPRRRFIQLRGLDDALIASRVHDMELLEGTWFSEAGVRELADDGRRASAEGQAAGGSRPPPGSSAVHETAVEAVLGDGIARELGRDRGKPRLEVGDTFELGPNQESADMRAKQWIVVGIMKSEGSTFGSEVWVKRSLVGPMFGKGNYFTSAVIRTRDADSARAIARDLTDNVRPALQALPERDYYAKLSDTNQQFLIAIIFVAVIMAIGGVFGIMNTMFSSINQRTRDIGILRLLGFSRGQILVSFFLESILIALVGGGLGCVLGWLADGWPATSIVSSGQGGGKSVALKLAVDATVLSAGLLFTLLMGALGGLVPALTAMRLKPLESLR
jgi:hypothetical protein